MMQPVTTAESSDLSSHHGARLGMASAVTGYRRRSQGNESGTDRVVRP